MNSTVYYFTGTGNSLVVARKIANLLSSKIIPISSVITSSQIYSEDKLIGIVFPCYLAQLSGLPLIVEDFIQKLKVKPNAYIFAICTYGGFGLANYIPTFGSLRKLASLNQLPKIAEFSIKMPLNNLDYDHIPVPINRNHEKMFSYTDKIIKKIKRYILNKQQNNNWIFNQILYSLTKPLFSILGKYVISALKEHAHVDNNSNFRDLIHLSDSSIYSDNKCNTCGTCVKICPVQNIIIINNRPKWLHKCEMCLACDEWCPQKSIHHWCKTIGKDYHHPDINISDLLLKR
jgi:formate hydrogenlyase subunit 6/NADH:ubiquinone oxidoreductase subunit I